MIRLLQYSIRSSTHDDMTVMFVNEGILLSNSLLSMVLFAGPVGPRAEVAAAKETLIGNAGLGGLTTQISQPCIKTGALLPDL